MTNSIQHTIHIRLTQLFAFLLPINPAWSAACIFFLTINWVFGLGFRGITKAHFQPKAFFIFVGLFILYCLGLVWSHNLQSGSREVETKMSLFLMPLVFFSVPLNSEQFKKTLQLFVIGCGLAMMGWILFAAYNFIMTKYYVAQGIKIWDFGVNYFFKERLSRINHPSYMAMYVCTAIWMILKVKDPLFQKKLFNVGFISLFALSTLLLISKAGILVLILIGVYSLYELIFEHRKIKLAGLVIGTFVLSFIFLFYFVPEFSQRFTSVFVNLKSQNNNQSDDSTGARMAVWEASTACISQHFFSGTGTGSANDALMQHYQTHGMTIAFKEHLNAHNQYLQTFITLGILGFIGLLVMLFYPLSHAISNRNLLYAGFIFIFAVNIFVESMLETQAGNLFFAFLNALLFMNSSQNHAP